MFYNTNVVRLTFPEITLHQSYELNPLNDQALIPNDEALDDENAIDEVTYDLDLVPTEHEAGEGEDSDDKSIKSVETDISISSQDCNKTKRGRTI